MGSTREEFGMVLEPTRSEKQDKELLKEEEKTSNAWFCQRIWKYKEKIFDKKRDKDTDDRMKRNILTHANPKWREQRSTCARILGPSESRYNEEEESWGGAYEVGQSDDEVEWLSKMVRSLQKLQKFGENS